MISRHPSCWAEIISAVRSIPGSHAALATAGLLQDGERQTLAEARYVHPMLRSDSEVELILKWN